MPQVSYSVLATLPDEHTASDYLRWLEGGHVQAVIAGGAQWAQVTRLHPSHGAVLIETRYLFPDVATFETYIKDHAPALRADGKVRFGSHPGVSFERREGTVILTTPPGVRPS